MDLRWDLGTDTVPVNPTSSEDGATKVDGNRTSSFDVIEKPIAVHVGSVVHGVGAGAPHGSWDVQYHDTWAVTAYDDWGSKVSFRSPYVDDRLSHLIRQHVIIN